MKKDNSYTKHGLKILFEKINNFLLNSFDIKLVSKKVKTTLEEIRNKNGKKICNDKGEKLFEGSYEYIQSLAKF